jgi:benzil reductase ((S)-benzoin forming)
MKLVIISGINRGLGQAIYNLLLMDSVYHIFGLSRTLTLEQHIDLSSNKFHYHQIDFTDLNSVMKLDFSNISTKSFSEIIFINNAAVIEPIGQLGELNNQKIIDAVNINITSPSIILNKTLDAFKKIDIKVINISSGAAKNPINGWALYCASKSFTNMLCNVIALQTTTNRTIDIVNFDPGVIDTSMQGIIRSKSESEFPGVSNFIELKETQKLQSPEDVALNILNLF